MTEKQLHLHREMFMDSIFQANEVDVGFHPDGYRIDKTASPMNRYTKCQIVPGQRWHNPKPVCFDSLPTNGWLKVDKFDWGQFNTNREVF
jgi:hypothetical protein